jgi:hypothetical protein
MRTQSISQSSNLIHKGFVVKECGNSHETLSYSTFANFCPVLRSKRFKFRMGILFNPLSMITGLVSDIKALRYICAHYFLGSTGVSGR